MAVDAQQDYVGRLPLTVIVVCLAPVATQVCEPEDTNSLAPWLDHLCTLSLLCGPLVARSLLLFPSGRVRLGRPLGLNASLRLCPSPASSGSSTLAASIRRILSL